MAAPAGPGGRLATSGQEKGTAVGDHQHTERPYLPAAGRDWGLPLYDPFVKLVGGDAARRRLIDAAALRGDERVLDVGCGTGTLMIALARQYPGLALTGVDPDPKALARASRKAVKARVSIRLDRGYSDALPYPDASFDRVFSSLMFHHVPADARPRTLAEVRRVLAPGGSFHLLDFGGPDAGHGWLGRRMHAGHLLVDNSEARLLALMQQAGLVGAKIGQGTMLFGHAVYCWYRAVAPAA